MTTLLLYLTMLASLAAGVVTSSYDRDRTQDKIQDQLHLQDGSCQDVTLPS